MQSCNGGKAQWPQKEGNRRIPVVKLSVPPTDAEAAHGLRATPKRQQKEHSEEPCEDTPGWKDPVYDCKIYAKRWCKDGKPRPGKEGTMGPRFKHPELNCCACGKKTQDHMPATPVSETYVPGDARLEKKIKKQKDKLRKDISDTKANILSLEQKIATDYGSDNVWYTLIKKCVTLRQQKYTYKICLFGKASQDSVHLGDWNGWANSHTMLFKGGAACWQAGPRGATVQLICGTSMRLLAVDEPHVCNYVFQMATPFACNTSYAASLRKQAHSNRHGSPQPEHMVTNGLADEL